MVLLSLGSNLSSKYGNRFQNIDLAISLLESYNVTVKKKSSYFESLSYPNKKNPKFINVMISIVTNLPPVDLASVILFIEDKIERKRDKKNDPRTCDIDIIDYNNKILNFTYKEFEFVVPHKDLRFRNFVLYPLEEINPGWKHPKTNEEIRVLIENLPDEDKKSILKINKS